jgi:hypothetical protein
LPDNSSLTRIRSRYGVEVFRRFFDAILEQCQQAGLVWGRELYFDSTEVQANAAYSSLAPRFAVEAREQARARREAEAALQAKEAVETHLSALFSTEGGPVGAPEDGSCEDASDTAPPRDQAQKLATADSTRFIPPETSVPSEPQEPPFLPISLPSEQRGALATANAERHDWLAKLGAQDRRETGSWYRRIADFRVSTTDSDAMPMHTKGLLDMGYHAHFVVDGGKARIIQTVLVTLFEVMDNQPMLDLLWHTCFRRQLWPDQVTGDKKFGTEANLVAIEGQGLRAYIPVPDMDHRTEFFAAEHFTYDAARDMYVCPAGKDGRLDQAHSTERQLRYRARAADCTHCPLKAQCTMSTQGRSLCRSVDEECLERVRVYL